MPESTIDLDQFRADTLAAGFDEVIERRWDPDVVVEKHTHPFDARAVIVQGEMWLAIGDEPARHLGRGDGFEVARETPHAERYGAEGATFWVARRR